MNGEMTPTPPDPDVIASLRQRRGLFRWEFTLTSSALVISSEGPLSRQKKVVELNSLARISPMQAPDPAVLAVAGLVALLALMLVSTGLLHAGYSALTVGFMTFVTLFVGGLLTRRVARSRLYVLETWGGSSFPIVFDQPHAEEVDHFIRLIRELSRGWGGSGRGSDARLDLAPTDGLAPDDDGEDLGPFRPLPGNSGDGPLEAHGMRLSPSAPGPAAGPAISDRAARRELDRLAELGRQGKLTPGEVELRKREILRFFAGAPEETGDKPSIN